MLKTRFFILLIAVTALGCKNNQKKSPADPLEFLYAKWHLTEVSGQMRTYTTRSENLPLLRGWERLEFSKDGIMSQTIPGPSDAPETHRGSWKYAMNKTKLLFALPNSTSNWTIEKLTKDTLILSRND